MKQIIEKYDKILQKNLAIKIFLRVANGLMAKKKLQKKAANLFRCNVNIDQNDQFIIFVRNSMNVKRCIFWRFQ